MTRYIKITEVSEPEYQIWFVTNPSAEEPTSEDSSHLEFPYKTHYWIFVLISCTEPIFTCTRQWKFFNLLTGSRLVVWVGGDLWYIYYLYQKYNGVSLPCSAHYTDDMPDTQYWNPDWWTKWWTVLGFLHQSISVGPSCSNCVFLDLVLHLCDLHVGPFRRWCRHRDFEKCQILNVMPGKIWRINN